MGRIFHRYHISLQRIEPLIWRRIQVPAEYSFWDLHVAIQDSMGWLDYHLHAFSIRNPVVGRTDEIGIPIDEFPSPDGPCLASWETPIADYFVKPTDRAEYAYDFGDDWQHTIKLESISELEKGAPALACLAGERRCPPEDCGGPYGYQDLLRVISDPTDPEYKQMMDWLGGSFDPEDFDPSQVKFDDPAKRWKRAFQDR